MARQGALRVESRGSYQNATALTRAQPARRRERLVERVDEAIAVRLDAQGSKQVLFIEMPRLRAVEAAADVLDQQLVSEYFSTFSERGGTLACVFERAPLPHIGLQASGRTFLKKKSSSGFWPSTLSSSKQATFLFSPRQPSTAQRLAMARTAARSAGRRPGVE